MKNPTKDDKVNKRVYRGGDWVDFAQSVRVSFRDYSDPLTYYPLGFRIIRSKQ
jgi:hypothetical protein